MNNNTKENKRKCAQKKNKLLKRKLLKQKNVVSEIAVEKVPDNVSNIMFEDLPNDIIKKIFSKVIVCSVFCFEQVLPVLSKKLLVVLKDANLHSSRALHVLSPEDANVKISAMTSNPFSAWTVHTINMGHMVTSDPLSALIVRTINMGHMTLPSAYPKKLLDSDRCDLLTSCEMLHTLNIDNCKVQRLAWLAGCKTLHTLTINHCDCDVSGLAELATCKTLHTLTINECNGLTNLAVLAGCNTLHTLNIRKCDLTGNNLGLAELATCKTLHTLTINECDAVSCRFAELATCKTLHTLTINECDGLTNLAVLAGCNTLHTLNIRKCDLNAEYLGCSAFVPVTLTFNYCYNLEGLGDCAALHTLDIRGSLIGVDELAMLAGCKMLQRLTVDAYCILSGVKLNFDKLADCKMLQSLSISSWEDDINLKGLKDCETLKTLTILYYYHNPFFIFPTGDLKYLQNLKLMLRLEDVQLTYSRKNGNLVSESSKPLEYVIDTYYPHLPAPTINDEWSEEWSDEDNWYVK